MSPRLLKKGSVVLAEPYSIIFTSSLQLGHFPSPWKDWNLTALHKKDDRSLPSNYRPSLFYVSPKKAWSDVFRENFLITYTNIIFSRPSSLALSQLLYTYYMFCEAVDSGKEVRVVFCDITKAFDRVLQRGLIHKLRDMGCSESLLKWFNLSNRRQRIVLNGLASEWTFITAGVPQGSILGPLLFLVYINDIVNELQAHVRLFADDTSLYIIVENPNNAAVTLNNDLSFISKWGDDWLVNFNTTKNLSMILSLKRDQPLHPPLYMNVVLVRNTSSHKHLGLTLANNCSWTEHIITLRALHGIGLTYYVYWNLKLRGMLSKKCTFLSSDSSLNTVM